jgi:hypothetical protein
MSFFHRDNGLKRVKPEELSDIAGNDWTTVWTKLDIVPYVHGSSLIGELRIGGKSARPIIARLGFSNSADVVYTLCETFGLSEAESLEFLDCKLGKDSVIVKVEEELVSYPDGSD